MCELTLFSSQITKTFKFDTRGCCLPSSFSRCGFSIKDGNRGGRETEDGFVPRLNVVLYWWRRTEETPSGVMSFYVTAGEFPIRRPIACHCRYRTVKGHERDTRRNSWYPDELTRNRSLALVIVLHSISSDCCVLKKKINTNTL